MMYSDKQITTTQPASVPLTHKIKSRWGILKNLQNL
jgi:hypothetical protein